TRRGRQETISRTLIENVEIAAVGARLNVAVEVDGKKRGVKPARAVTLFVKPDAVPRIHLAEQMGKIKLSMRNSDDRVVRNVNDISRENDVLGLPPAAARSANSDGLMDKIKAMFQKRDDDLDSKLKALERQPITIAGVAHFEPAWRMRIWNGERRTDLGWDSLNSWEPIELRPPNRDETKPNITPGQTAAKPAANVAEKDGPPSTDEPSADWGNNDHVPE
ncbi:MAG: hypothetical protein IID33_00200, partial [Planctomycetes bacterium]|nr:hypothetical protein [Planctomycetota bacterium]